MTNAIPENPRSGASRLSEKALEVNETITPLYDKFRSQLPGVQEGIRFIDVANNNIHLPGEVETRPATEEERNIAKDFLLSMLDSIDKDQNMPVEKKVIASNYLRKLLAALEQGRQAA